jgi:predicted phage terminase large subunit-like protein
MPSSIDSTHASTFAHERQTRQRIRTDLHEWAVAAGFHPAAHHALLLDELARVADGSTDRLMVLMPPGSAKSTYASILFPAWWFVRHPGSSVIAASHTADLAEHFGRQVRALVVEHGPRLGYALTADNRAAARWQISRRGQYYATGVRGPITGRRADLAIIDDPVRSQADADNKALRDSTWTWFRSDLTTRLKPRGRVIVIMTRWHVDDLCGRLLALQPDEWRTLRLPALAEANDPLGRAPGEALWPEWEDRAALERKRAIVGERAWSALFQQDPRPDAGNMFRVERIAVLAALSVPPGSRTIRAWDLAATAEREGGDPDWTAGVKLSLDDAGRVAVLDVVRLRGDAAEVGATIARTASRDGREVVIGLPQDPGQAGKTQVTYLAKELRGYTTRASPETGSKIKRAEPVMAQAQSGNLAVLQAPWTAAFIDELREFPHGAKDDQVDALSRGFALLIAEPEPGRRARVEIMGR